MKNTWITLAVWIGTLLNGTAQDRLNYGAPNEKAVIQLPHFFMDALRLQQDDFTKEVPYGNNGWKKTQHYITRQSTPGKFEELQNNEWNTSDNKPVKMYRHLYRHDIEGSEVVSMQELSWQKDENGSADEHNLFKYFYSSGRLTRIEEQEYDSIDNVYSTESETFLLYDNEGKRIKDSIVLAGYPNFYMLDLYRYNQYGNCNAMYSLVKMGNKLDTVVITLAGYDNGLINRYTTYVSFGESYIPTEQLRFAYDKDNRLTAVAKFIQDEFNPQNLVIHSTYHHYYTTQSKLKAISTYGIIDQNAGLVPLDSVAIIYDDSHKAVSGYGYTNDGTSAHLPVQPTSRYIFGPLATSVKYQRKVLQNALVYPNPAIHTISLSEHSKYDSYTIIDMTGKVMAKSENMTKEEIDIAHLPAGMYLITAIDRNGHTYVAKFSKDTKQ